MKKIIKKTLKHEVTKYIREAIIKAILSRGTE